MEENTYIILPVFNEARIIQEVIEEIRSAGFNKIIAIDDGSKDNSFEILKKNNIVALRHPLNRGKGAAIKTGFEAAKILEAKYVVTFDSDGQHEPKDIRPMINLLDEGYNAVLGSRLIKRPEGMPTIKIIANQVGNFFTWVLYGIWVTDSQSGLRAYDSKAIEKINVFGDGYEFDSEVIREISKNNLRFIETPITIRYTEYSKRKIKKQGFINGLKTLFKLFLME